MDHKLIVFDWNGTILADTEASWMAANTTLKFFGAAEISLRRYRETTHFPVIHFYRLNGVDVDTLLKHKQESNDLFQTAYEKAAVKSRTRRGTRDLLKWVKKQGYGCIVLSNYLTERIEAHIVRLGLEGYFHHISAHECDGTTILENTTKAARLSDFMLKRGYKPHDTVIIGDSTEEPEIAHKLGLQSISVSGGYFDVRRLRKSRPDYLISNMEKVRPILSNIVWYD